MRLAYVTLGSIAEAEDVVQDAWLRLERVQEPEAIDDLRAWLTRVVGRLALDALRRAHRTREQYIGEWLPEPVVEEWSDPADKIASADSVSIGLAQSVHSAPARLPSQAACSPAAAALQRQRHRTSAGCGGVRDGVHAG